MIKHIKKIKTILDKLLFEKYGPFNISVREQKSFLYAFKEPSNNIERSFFQYKCQMFLMGKWLKCIYNFLAFFLLIGLGIKWIWIKFQKDTLASRFCCDAIFIRNGLSETLLPEELCDKYVRIKKQDNLNRMYIDDEMKAITKTIIKKYPLSFLFLAKCILKMSMYAELLRSNKTNAIIVSAEYSYTSSVLTEYCNMKGITHINIMHGEKLFNIRDSFFAFDEFYIWDSYYETLFSLLRAAQHQYICIKPTQIFVSKKNQRKVKDYTYYLGGERKEELQAIYKQLLCLKQKGLDGCVRMHPIYSDRKVVNRIFKEIKIENPSDIEIENSLSQSRFIIALYSTVLFQAYNSGLDVIIDDISMPQKFYKLKKAGYIMMQKDVVFLSEIV